MDDASIAYLGLVDDEEIALDHAALALAALDRPGLDTAPHVELLDGIAARLAEIGAAAETGEERARLLTRVIAREHGFTGDAESYDDPANADLARVIERRRGLPVSLSILYVAAARAVGWEADALDVPGHVLVLVGDPEAPVILDPFRDGIVVPPETLMAILSRGSDEEEAVRSVAAMSNRGTLVRLLNNQATRAEAAGQGRRALTLYSRMTTVAPAECAAWWERARLELVDGDVAAARASFGAMLEMTRDPELRAKVSQALGALAA